jgi:hypothetical protein
MSRRQLLLTLLAAALLSGCDQLGIETPAKKSAAKEAEGRAIGSACRHAGRAIEDCFEMNPRAQKAAMFAGWKEMNDYMRENKIEEVKPASALASETHGSEDPPAADSHGTEPPAPKDAPAADGHKPGVRPATLNM